MTCWLSSTTREHRAASISLIISIFILMAAANKDYEMELAKSSRSQIDDDRMKLPNTQQTSN